MRPRHLQDSFDDDRDPFTPPAVSDDLRRHRNGNLRRCPVGGHRHRHHAIKLEHARHYYLQAHILNAHTRNAQQRIGRVAHHMVELSTSTERLSDLTQRRMHEQSPKPPVVIGVAQHV